MFRINLIRRALIGAGASLALMAAAAIPAVAIPAVASAANSAADAERTVILTPAAPVQQVNFNLFGGTATAPRVVIPGARGSSALSVTNRGETAGTLTVQIVDVALVPPASQSVTNAVFERFTVNGHPISAIYAGAPFDIEILDNQVSVSESVAVPFDWAFPAVSGGITPGNTAVEGLRHEIRFTVRVAMSGADLPAPPAPPPATPTPPTPPPPPTPPIVLDPPAVTDPPDINLPPTVDEPAVDIAAPPIFVPPGLGVTPPLDPPLLPVTPPVGTPAPDPSLIPPEVAVTGDDAEPAEGAGEDTAVPEPPGVVVTGNGGPVIAETGGVVLLGQPVWLWGLGVLLVALVFAYARKPASGK